MFESFFGGNSFLGIISQHHAQQLDALGLQPRDQLIQRYRYPIWKRHFEPIQLGHSRSYFFTGCPQNSKNLVQLVDLTFSGEYGLFGDHLCENRSNRPDINSLGVMSSVKQDFRRAIPQGNHFARAMEDGDLESSCKSEVGYF